MSEKGLNDILAVLVLYRRELFSTETFISLSRSLQRRNGCLDIFVYDNSPLAAKSVSTGRYGSWNVIYRHDPTNPGVSAAYNRGFRAARELGKQWLLLLDQDTAFPEDALDRYVEAMEVHGDVQVIAPVLKGANEKICSPCCYRLRTGFHMKEIAAGMYLLQGKALLNSGLLVGTDRFEQCGGFDERIRLDFSDFVFNNRLRRYCDRFYLLPLQCAHGFSGGEETDMDAALQRFRIFQEGALQAAETLADRFFYSLVVFKRCLRLTLQFRSLRFLTASLGFGGGKCHG